MAKNPTKPSADHRHTFPPTEPVHASPEMGDIPADVYSVWGTLAERGAITLRCDGCGEPVKVSLSEA